MVHILVGETEAEKSLQQSLTDGKAIPWIVLKAAKKDEKVLLFFANRMAFLGHGIIVSKVEPATFHGTDAYGAKVRIVDCFDPPVRLDAVARQFPEWAWPRGRMKGRTTPPAPLGNQIYDFVLAQNNQEGFRGPDQVDHVEGAADRIWVNRYERDPRARSACIAKYGDTCCICGFAFGAVYGPDAEGYIQVHHLRPLSKCGGKYVVDPVKDLRPVCPNCHAVLHLGDRCRTIEEVRELLARHQRSRD